MRLSSALLAMMMTAALMTGCAANQAAWQGVTDAVAVLQPTAGNKAHGVVRFAQQDDGVLVTFDVQGLEPGSTHAIHVHDCGDCTASDGSSACGHYNPEGHPHALPPTTPRHAGDMGNIVADEHGVAEARVTFSNMSVAGSRNPILGRSVILHAKPDTGRGESGEAGARIACGVIGIAMPSMPMKGGM